MMGAAGLRRATGVAVLSANYVAQRLAAHYPVLYTGRNGLVAHECVIDLRPLTGTPASPWTTGQAADRLRLPRAHHVVPGGRHVHDRAHREREHRRVDRFCDAMIAIRAEIARVADGTYDPEDNPLKNAPHTAEMLIAGEWKHAYPQEEAAYPPGVGPPRQVLAAGAPDRPGLRRPEPHCACPPPEAFAS